MGIAPPRPCQRCGRIKRGRCLSCKARRDRENDAIRPDAASRGYGPRWTAFARDWLVRYPWCGQRVDGRRYVNHSTCVARGLSTLADCVDHIASMRSGGQRFDPANLQSLCGNCNRRKNIATEGGFGRAPKVTT